MKVVSIWRSRSGLAWASCSCRKWAGSILLGAVIASFSWVCGRSPEDHAVAASTFRARYSPGPSHTTLVDATGDLGRRLDVGRRAVAGSACWAVSRNGEQHADRSVRQRGSSRLLVNGPVEKGVHAAVRAALTSRIRAR